MVILPLLECLVSTQFAQEDTDGSGGSSLGLLRMTWREGLRSRSSGCNPPYLTNLPPLFSASGRRFAGGKFHQPMAVFQLYRGNGACKRRHASSQLGARLVDWHAEFNSKIHHDPNLERLHRFFWPMPSRRRGPTAHPLLGSRSSLPPPSI